MTWSSLDDELNENDRKWWARLEKAVLAERERCAKIAEAHSRCMGRDIAAAIRDFEEVKAG